MRKPHKIDVSLDSEVDLKDLSREISLGLESVAREVSISVAAAYVVIKGFQTFCGMLEHIVVTKVK